MANLRILKTRPRLRSSLGQTIDQPENYLRACWLCWLLKLPALSGTELWLRRRFVAAPKETTPSAARTARAARKTAAVTANPMNPCEGSSVPVIEQLSKAKLTAPMGETASWWDEPTVVAEVFPEAAAAYREQIAPVVWLQPVHQALLSWKM